MDDMFLHIINNFSFTEIICFYLLWRVENKLTAATDAISKLLSTYESDIVSIKRQLADNEKRPSS